MIKTKDIASLFDRLNLERPNPKSELRYENHFQLLIAVILSAQATDQSVNRVTPELFKIASSPEKMILLGEDGIKNRIQSIGLANSKAKNILRCCRQLVSEHNSVVPRTREELEKLAGVGRKTAAMVLGNAEAIVMAVAEELGVAFVSRLAAARDLELGRVVEVKIEGMDLTRAIFLTRNQRIPSSRAQSEFWEFVAQDQQTSTADHVKQIAHP